MSTAHDHPRIKGEWMQADSSRNHLELVPTEKEGVIAVRNSFDPGEVLYTTGNQLAKLTEAVQSGRMKNLIRW